MSEPVRRRSSTASTTPTPPTTSAVAVAVAATATRDALPTCVTVPTPRERLERQTANNLITSRIGPRTTSGSAQPGPHVVLQAVSLRGFVKGPQQLTGNVPVEALSRCVLLRRSGTHYGVCRQLDLGSLD
jgi:hypothetical protein